MKKISLALTTAALAFTATTASANCDSGERVVKFSHVTGGTTHPKVVAANSFADRVNKEMDGKL
ncbi:MAG: C4-dicarboxylate ABC transporter, partial [Marinomonas sp.]